MYDEQSILYDLEITITIIYTCKVYISIIILNVFIGLLDKVCSTQKTEDKRMVAKHTIYEPSSYDHSDQCTVIITYDYFMYFLKKKKKSLFEV